MDNRRVLKSGIVLIDINYRMRKKTQEELLEGYMRSDFSTKTPTRDGVRVEATKFNGTVAQSGSMRLPVTQEITGSNPVGVAFRWQYRTIV